MSDSARPRLLLMKEFRKDPQLANYPHRFVFLADSSIKLDYSDLLEAMQQLEESGRWTVVNTTFNSAAFTMFALLRRV